MKVPLAFDPDMVDYGPASGGVRAILRAWGELDWFAPPSGDPEAAFRAHLAAAQRHDAESFPDARVECVAGDWDDFIELCLCVRERPGWDWKFTGLKPLNAAHSRARGWMLDDQPSVDGGLWIRLPSGTTIWTLRWPDAAIAAAPEPARVQAGFYLSYANMDVVEAIEWQLADGHDDLADNPYVPLIATYAAGGYPFCMAADEYVLFTL